MFRRHKNTFAVLGFVVLIAFWISLLAFISPEEVVAWVGVQNAYGIIFLLAVVGGLSTITGTSLFATIATFAAGGADLALLSVVAGIGIFVSDSIFFLIAQHGAQSIKPSRHGIRSHLNTWVERIPRPMLQVGVYLYVGITPLPNDALMIALALSRVSYRMIMPALFAGSMTIATLTAYLGEYLL